MMISRRISPLFAGRIFSPMSSMTSRSGLRYLLSRRASPAMVSWVSNSRPGMFPNESAQPHDRTQRLWTARVESALRPLTALLTQYRRSVDPIAARGQNRSAEPTRPEAVAELARLLPSVHPNLFHAFIEDPDAAAVPA